MRNKLILLFSIFLISLTITSNGQKLVNSPYSRFNLGSIEPSGSFRSQGMGGISVSQRDNTSIYFSNPASYSSFDTISFIFDFGVDYTMGKLSDGESTYSSKDGNFDHLFFGFPLAKGWGLAAGISPYSNGYYKLTESVLDTDADYDPMIGEFSSYHAGDGGLTSVFLGSGINITKNFSAGINMTLLFGQMNRTNQFDFADYYNVFHNNTSEKLEISGINFDYGLQYRAKLGDNYFLNAGASLTSGKDYNTNYERLIYRYTAYSTKDTLSLTAVEGKSTYIPATMRVGISVGKVNKFTAGFDYISTNWSTAKIPGGTGNAADSRSYLFGLEFIPDKFSNYNLLKRLEYRIGGHAGDSYLILNGEQIKEIGASAGIGMTLRRTESLSKANLYLDYTRRSGSTANGLHSEDYFTVGISLNLYDWWFMKRKYE
ncbi:MAG: hypothetical protein IPH69_02490 [Bacteroidales bacterium]|nr:hypothetical protein [Bacteroidales bacterium]MBK7627090.1 hypothetical protein [Bacteroidales bacterium]